MQRGHLVYDPFVGTGSILVAAAYHGAYTLGADIDIRVVRDGTSPASSLILPVSRSIYVMYMLQNLTQDSDNLQSGGASCLATA